MQTEGRAPLSGDDPTATPASQADPPSHWSLPSPTGDTDAGSATPSPPGRRRLVLLLAVAFGVLLIDQVSKVAIVATMARHDPVRLLGGLVTVTYTRNSGAAFSMGTGFTFVFTAVAVAVVVVILRTSRRLNSAAWAVALGALLGGALGNLADRLVRSPGFGRGHVVDWIEPPHFAVFNLADASISCAAVGMVLLTFLGRDLDGTRHRQARSRTPAGADHG
jgi:signal peptidase II